MKMFTRRIVVLPLAVLASSVLLSPFVASAQAASTQKSDAPTASPAASSAEKDTTPGFLDKSLSNFFDLSDSPPHFHFFDTTTPKAKTFDRTLDADLRTAVKDENVKKVRDLLKRNADPNLKDTDSYATPLLCVAASDKSDIGVVQALVEAGADLEAKNSQGASALTLSTLDGHVAILQYLLKAGANIEAKTSDGLTPLMLAASAGETETVRLLMQAGANVNARSATNGTPLIYGSAKTVAGTGNLEIIKMLVNAGADVSVKAANGKTADETAAVYGLTDINEYLVSIFNRDLALFNATAKAYRERETADSSTRIANWKVVQDALAAGANPRFSGSGNRTALLFLTYDLPNADDATVNSILTRSDLNVQENEYGDTPLHSAAQNNYEKMVALLIKAGAKLDIQDNEKQTPLDTAFKYDFNDIVGILQKAGAKGNPLAVSNSGRTKLMALTIQKPFDAPQAEMLIKAGVDVNATNKRIDTALMLACDSSSPEAVKFLIKNGANVNFVDIDGGTALMYGAQLKSGDDALDIVQQLIAAKADVNAKSHKGNTALSLARANSNLHAADALRKAGAEDVNWG